MFNEQSSCISSSNVIEIYRHLLISSGLQLSPAMWHYGQEEVMPSQLFLRLLLSVKACSACHLLLDHAIDVGLACTFHLDQTKLISIPHLVERICTCCDECRG